MGSFKTKGIILSENNMGDFDKMVTLLTPSGKIGCAAKGARRNNSALMAATQYMCFGDYMIYKGNNSYKINSCETIEVFYNIRTDLDKLKYAVHISKITNDVTDENQNTYRILQLILNTLYVISETDKNLDLVLSVFRLRLLCIMGFKPQIDKCSSCNKNDNIKYFSIRDNSVKCEECGRIDKSSLNINITTYDAIKYISSVNAKKIFSFDIPEESIKELDLLTKLYLNEKLEKEYRMEEFW
ncbi:MAG: DNA repair protein RecO [Clostridia bacterium]|nr:DNA repair protein RecO [Clostridia bacterium]